MMTLTTREREKHEMGDRALVFFHDGDVELSPCVYLHWTGGKVPTYIEQVKERMGDRPGDVPYTTARFIGLCHEDITGNLSLGVWNATVTTPQEVREQAERLSHGDNGVFLVNCSTWDVEHFGGYDVEEEE